MSLALPAYCVAPLAKGWGIGLGLIIAIGPQNAFILKQGILRNQVLVSILTCILADVLMIYLGVSQLGHYITCNPALLEGARWGGAAFLGYYGLKSFRAIWGSHSLTIDAADPYKPSLKETITTLLAVSFLNPYMYLDTFVLIGGIGAQFPELERPFFTLGAIFASIVWFSALGFGARYLAPLFKKPSSWKVLEFFIGCVMWVIALMLIFKY